MKQTSNPSKTIKSSEILDKKIFHEIENGGNITEFIISYVNDKTYKSFRTFSKKLKEIVKLLFEDGIIDEKDLKKIEECISIKTKFRKPEIIFNLPSFLKEYTEMFEFSKKNKNNLTNWFFLLIPFLIAKGLKEIKNIKYKEIKFHKLPNCLILEYYPSAEDNLDSDLKEEPMCIKITSYYKEYEDMYNLLKEGRTDDEKIFDIIPPTHHHFNILLDNSLRKYVSDTTSPYKYFTIVKNYIKYSKDSFVTLL